MPIGIYKRSEKEIFRLRNIAKMHKIEGKHKGNKYRAKKIIQTDLFGNAINIFDCIRDAARSLKISPSGITMCARGQLKTCGGFKWNYLKLEQKNNLPEAIIRK